MILPNCRIPLADALMSGFAAFSLKHPSLLAFEEHYKKEPDNLHGVYGVGIKPSGHPSLFEQDAGLPG